MTPKAVALALSRLTFLDMMATARALRDLAIDCNLDMTKPEDLAELLAGWAKNEAEDKE
jgi:hypothetical protein